MKLKVWNEESKICNDDKQLFLRLKEESEGILLYVVDKNGEPIENPHLIMIDQSDYNCMILLDNFNDSIPLKSNAFHELIVVTEKETQARAMHVAQFSTMFNIHNMTNAIQQQNENKVKH